VRTATSTVRGHFRDSCWIRLTGGRIILPSLIEALEASHSTIDRAETRFGTGCNPATSTFLKETAPNLLTVLCLSPSCLLDGYIPLKIYYPRAVFWLSARRFYSIFTNLSECEYEHHYRLHFHTLRPFFVYLCCSQVLPQLD
jgi:hypothetical protein